MQRRHALSLLFSGLGGLLPDQLIAQNSILSGRTLKFLVGYPGGGVADFIARTSTDGLNALTQATTVVENRPGAAGNIALEAVAKANPESGIFGAFGNLQVTMNPHVAQLSPKGVDPMRDLVPVVALADMILLLAVTPQLGVKTFDQFLAKAKELGPGLRMGLAGIGAPHHLAALLLQKNAGLDMTLVPYKGGAPMIADAAGGHLDAVITTLPVGNAMVQAGKLHWIAVVPPTTIPSLPEVPSMSKVLKGENIPTGNTIFAPAATPVAVLNELHDAVNKLLATPAVGSKLRANGLEPTILSRAELPSRLRDEAAYMKDFLSKVKVDFST
jgi:tripartite-type tricarboxylate transporter receptor subunit TctC